MFPEKHFTHLHLHTDYSLLDGAITLDKLVDFGVKNKLKALAISDHGNIFAAVKFFEKCKKNNIKPIIGMEAYIVDDRFIRNIQKRYYHLLLLVQNERGYKNLCKLISYSYSDGFYFKPRIDYSLLERYNEGLIATSTCIGGHIPQLLLNNQEEEAIKKIHQLQNIFGDRYYLEVQPPSFDKQIILNEKLFLLEKEINIPMIATGDCHYATKDDRYAHEVMLAVQTRTTMDDESRMTFGDCRSHMQTVDEMLATFSDRQDIVWRTGEVADRCEFEFSTGKFFFPDFPLPKDITTESFFRKECLDGFNELLINNRFNEFDKEKYMERLIFEMNMIIKMGFITYFLVVSDFIKWAKKNKIAVGPGRGSAVGSLVSWALQITDMDPIKYNLFFERFLNPERITMPDIDIDFCIHGREKVIEYVKNKYGNDRVCQIITFGSMMAKGVIKDVARALAVPFEDANYITELIPNELKITLDEALNSEPKLKDLYDKNPKIKEVFDIAKRLEGITRHASKHAAGIVISPEPISDVLPIYIPSKSTDIVTQYAMTELETLGFLKIDFLGLKNLTLITNVINLIYKNKGILIDLIHIPLDDKKTFDLLCRGDSLGVFQLESDGLRDVLRRLKPQYFEDIIAVNALYRPGPLGSGMVDDFIERRHGRQKIIYAFPELESVLKETYGVMVYQEQVIKIASVIGNYTLGEADILRRAMGKKKAEIMAEQKEIFIKKAVANNFDKQKSSETFDLMAYFAGYGFNKAHSAAYGLIAYQTAYLKANYPVEFMSSLISLEVSNPDAFVSYVEESRSMGITLLPPNVLISEKIFVPEDNAIRFGLLGIKGVGEVAVDSIINARQKNTFIDFIDFCSKLDLRVCNKRVIEHLILSGAVDNFDKKRSEKFHNLEVILKRAEEDQDKNKTGQIGLFDFFKSEDILTEDSGVFFWEKSEDWSNMSLLEKEKEVLGIYLSHHPLDSFHHLYLNLNIKFLKNIDKGSSEIFIANLISLKEVTTKKGDLMAFGLIEDKQSRAEIVIFPTLYKKYQDILKRTSLFFFSGDTTESSENHIKIKVSMIIELEKFNYENHLSELIFFINKTNLEKSIELIKSFVSGKQKISFISDNSFLENEKKIIKYTLNQKFLLSTDNINLLYNNSVFVYKSKICLE